MERWGLSPRISTPSPGQCHVRQRYLRQWRADGDLADQPTDAPCTTDARTTRPYSRRAQRQCRPSSHLRGDMTVYRTIGVRQDGLREDTMFYGGDLSMSQLPEKAETAGRAAPLSVSFHLA